MLELLKKTYWWIAEHSWRALLKHLAYSQFLPPGFQLRVRRYFWNARAGWVHSYWGQGAADYHILGALITQYNINSVLDLGCGSGRLFSLYQSLSLSNVLGIDISQTALEIARLRSPQVRTLCTSLEEMALSDQRFDLGVSSRTLQHVPRKQVGAIIANVCRYCRLVFVNEVSKPEGHDDVLSFYLHDYAKHFANAGCQLRESGPLDNASWTLWGPA